MWKREYRNEKLLRKLRKKFADLIGGKLTLKRKFLSLTLCVAMLFSLSSMLASLRTDAIESQLSAMYAAYYELLSAKVNEHGLFDELFDESENVFDFAQTDGNDEFVGFAHLVDFDNDGYPELVIGTYTGGTPPTSWVYIYRYTMGGVELINTSEFNFGQGFGDFPMILYTPDGRAFLAVQFSMPRFGATDTSYYSIVNGSWVEVLSTGSFGGPGTMDEEPQSFSVNGRTVSEAEYRNAYFEYLGFDNAPWESYGDDPAFEESPHFILGYYDNPSVHDTLNELSKLLADALATELEQITEPDLNNETEVAQNNNNVSEHTEHPGEYIYTSIPGQYVYTPSLDILQGITDEESSLAALREVLNGLTDEQRSCGETMNIITLLIENIERRGTSQDLPDDDSLDATRIQNGTNIASQLQREADEIISQTFIEQEAMPPGDVLTPNLTIELSALIAYREILTMPQFVEVEYHGILHWDINSILHAEIIDFDNDGIPELVLVIDTEPTFHWEIEVKTLIIYTYDGQVKIIFSGRMGRYLGAGSTYMLVYSTDNQIYLVDSGIDHGDSWFEYSTLHNGEWITVFQTSEIINDETGGFDYYIDGNNVDFQEYLYGNPLNLTDYSRSLWDANDSPRNLLDYINSRLADIDLESGVQDDGTGNNGDTNTTADGEYPSDPNVSNDTGTADGEAGYTPTPGQQPPPPANEGLLRHRRTNLNFESNETNELHVAFPDDVSDIDFDRVTIEAEFASVTLNREHIVPGGEVRLLQVRDHRGHVYESGRDDDGGMMAFLGQERGALELLGDFWSVLVVAVFVITWLVLARFNIKLRLWVVPTFSIIAIGINVAMVVNRSEHDPLRYIEGDGTVIQVTMTEGKRAVVSIPAYTDTPESLVLLSADGEPQYSKYNPVTGNIDSNIRESGVYVLREHTVSFADIEDKSQMMKDAIVRLASRNILHGTEDGYFYPDMPITHAEFVSAIVMAFDMLDLNAQTTFTDVGSNDWYFRAVATAEQAGLIIGFEDNMFRGSSDIHRDYLTQIASNSLVERMGYFIPSNVEGWLARYVDRPEIIELYEDGVALATQTNIVIQRTDSRFAPKTVMTRGDAAIVLDRLFNRVW
jgi:hypothetical protein